VTDSRPFPAQFRDAARRWPDRVAVELAAPGPGLTYAALDGEAAAVAAALGRAGVRPGSYVGVSLASRVNFCTGLLGTWRHAAVPVPLDAQAPLSYVRSICAAVPLAATLTDGGRPRDHSLDLRAVRPGQRRAQMPWPPGRGTAYVMHTSGSTGAPKGVAVSHQALGSYCGAFTSAVALTAADRFLQMAPLTFDVVLEELLPVWAAGGTAVLAAPGPADPARFLRQIARSRVTVAEITTAYWSLLTRHLGRSAAAVPGCLRLLIAGGEPAPPGLLQRSLDLGLPIGHVYGVTEAAITSAIGIFRRGQPPAGTPVGAPLSNSAVHIMGDGGQLVPRGEQGEVWIGGQGLADGYAGDPELTARRFVTGHPGLPPGRYYRTGDLGRWQEDGMLEILGRVDAQVKVKGIRVEPAEIEASLARAPGVVSVAVVAAGDGPEHRRLVAFVVPSAGQPAAGIERAVRGFLQQRLPAHLVPASVIAVPALPLTRHGKIDRQQLRDLYQARARPCALRPGPRRAEAVVTAIWSTVVGRHPASPDQNFFDAGGDSLALLQIVTGLQDSGHDISVDDFLRWPTVHGLATALDRQAAHAAEAVLQDARAREAKRRGRPRRSAQHEENP
jgi:amino acid adenylation domain-containing protein